MYTFSPSNEDPILIVTAFPLDTQDFVYTGPSHLLGQQSLVYLCLLHPHTQDSSTSEKRCSSSSPITHTKSHPHSGHWVILHWIPQSQTRGIVFRGAPEDHGIPLMRSREEQRLWLCLPATGFSEGSGSTSDQWSCPDCKRLRRSSVPGGSGSPGEALTSEAWFFLLSTFILLPGPLWPEQASAATLFQHDGWMTGDIPLNQEAKLPPWGRFWPGVWTDMTVTWFDSWTPLKGFCCQD